MPAAGDDPYLDFVRAKIIALPPLGIPLAAGDVPDVLKPHQAAIVRWAVEGGRRAIFAAFGLGKSLMQLAIMQLLGRALGGNQLIVVPLTVVTEFLRDAKLLGLDPVFVRTSAEVLAHGKPGLFLTNYESVREGKLDLSLFNAASLDEASCLRGFGGTKTFREFMRLFDGMQYKFVATATPSPNDYIELLAYAAFLEVMDVGQAKTRFFRRNSEKADELTIHPHKVDEFWLWVNSWAAFVQRPSDLGFSDEGYVLPALDVRWHEVPSEGDAGADKGGQAYLIKPEAIGLVEAAREKRDSLGARIAKMMELRTEDPAAHRILWHDLESERAAIERAVPAVASIYGSQDLAERARRIVAFSDGEVQELAAKPVLAGSGCNFQRHCAWAIFLGIGFKFNDLIQAIHRIQRFLQTRQVRIDLIHSEAERAVRRVIEEKWARHEEMTARMSEIIRRYGLGLAGAREVLERTVEDGTGEVENGPPCPTTGQASWTVARGDTVLHSRTLPTDSVGLIVTSVPFGTQYEYSPSYNDFGHTDDSEHFFRQMDFLTPELLRVLQPGRILAVHVKDRVRPGGMDGLGFQTLDPFSDHCVAHFRKHGFAFLSRITITTDVVRENAQTYRLGWSEQCKDGTRQGNGVPEYLLRFRKPQSDRSKGYADVPVVKGKPAVELIEGGEVIDWDDRRVRSSKAQLVPGSGYSRSRWQTDAAGYWRSAGDRLLAPEDLVGIPHDAIFRLYRGFSATHVYDHEHHVALMESVERRHALPTDFSLLPVQSWDDEAVWSDVARMLGANTAQAAKGREQHLCPLPFDIVDRAILGWSNPGETVYDPFGGLMTVPLRAVRHGRRGMGVELNPRYFADGVRLLREQDASRAGPTLFDLIRQEQAA